MEQVVARENVMVALSGKAAEPDRRWEGAPDRPPLPRFPMTRADFHTPVLAQQIARLARGRRRAVDGTAGGGGHTAILRNAGAEVLAIDRDPEAVTAARARLATEGATWVSGCFAAPEILAAIARFGPDFILLDLGVSSHQIDCDVRGFSFRPGVVLDMRMSGKGPSAADLLNEMSEQDLAILFRTHADERRARPLARAIVARRARHAFTISDDLVNAIRQVLGPRSGPGDFARLFQAVRIAVNRELEELERGLPLLRDALRPAGLLAVIAYHSGEDRIVKHTFREWCRTCVCPPEFPVCRCRGHALGRLVTRRPIMADDAEVADNPRARSARLRVFEHE